MKVISMKTNFTQCEVEFKFDCIENEDENSKLSAILKNDGYFDTWNLSFFKNEKIPLSTLLKIIQSIFESKDFNIQNLFIERLENIDGSIMLKKSDTNNYEDYAEQLLKHFFVNT